MSTPHPTTGGKRRANVPTDTTPATSAGGGKRRANVPADPHPDLPPVTMDITGILTPRPTIALPAEAPTPHGLTSAADGKRRATSGPSAPPETPPASSSEPVPAPIPVAEWTPTVPDTTPAKRRKPARTKAHRKGSRRAVRAARTAPTAETAIPRHGKRRATPTPARGHRLTGQPGIPRPLRISVAAVTSTVLTGGAILTGLHYTHPQTTSILPTATPAATSSAQAGPTQPATTFRKTSTATVLPGTSLRIKPTQLAAPPTGPPIELPDPKPAVGTASIDFGIWSFNILGSLHTKPGADAAEYADGPTRAAWAVKYLNVNPDDPTRPDIAGLQEAENDQLAVLNAPDTGWATYPKPGPGFHAQALAWRTSVFELVDAHTYDIPFINWTRPQQVALLRHKATGRLLWVINTHLAPQRGHGAYQNQRDEGTRRLIKEGIRLRSQPALDPATGKTLPGGQPGQVPVLFTGDMNQTDATFCPVTAAGFHAAQGGSIGPDCRMPPARIDWIFGSSDVKFSRFWFDDTQRHRITDHKVARSHVTLPAL